MLIRIDSKKKRIAINERYEKLVKIAVRITLLCSFILIFVALPFPVSILVGLAVFFAEQILERVVFSFTVLYIASFPSFELWRKAGFLASYFAISKDKSNVAVVGMIFENRSAAKEVFDVINTWNEGMPEDPNNDVCVSIVIDERKNKYALFVYPSLERESIKAFQKQSEESAGDKEVNQSVAMMIMCKLFPFQNSGLQRAFLPLYEEGEKFLFGPFVLGEKGFPVPIREAQPIVKYHLKIKKRSELTQSDVEKHMSDYNLDWDDDSPVQPGKIYRV
jgi:hypothetical protein